MNTPDVNGQQGIKVEVVDELAAKNGRCIVASVPQIDILPSQLVEGGVIKVLGLSEQEAIVLGNALLTAAGVQLDSFVEKGPKIGGKGAALLAKSREWAKTRHQESLRARLESLKSPFIQSLGEISEFLDNEKNKKGAVQETFSDWMSEVYGLLLPDGVEPADVDVEVMGKIVGSISSDTLNSHQLRELRELARKMFQHTVFGLNTEVIKELEQKIARARSERTKQSLHEMHRALSLMVYDYFDALGKRFDPEKLNVLEEIMREKVGYYTNEKGEKVERANTVIMVNGFELSGKDTTLGILKLGGKVETGTNGISGRRGEGYEIWEETSGQFDPARSASKYVPTPFMRAWFAVEMVRRRVQMDAVRKMDTPIVVSGFPRDEVQARVFNGLKGIKSVYLSMSRGEAVKRNITRLIEAVQEGKEVRQEALDALVFAVKGTGKDKKVQKTSDQIMQHIKTAVKDAGNMGKTAPEILRYLPKGITRYSELSEKARYNIDARNKDEIIKALNSLGAETVIVNVENEKGSKSKLDVANEVADALGLPRVVVEP